MALSHDELWPRAADWSALKKFDAAATVATPDERAVRLAVLCVLELLAGLAVGA